MSFGQFGGSYFFQNITERDGFNPSHIDWMLEDKRGFIWYATQDGLNRYDGYKIEKFVTMFGQVNSLSGNYVSGLAEDSDGKIWIATAYEGLNSYDPIKKRFERFKHLENDSNSLVDNMLKRIFIDRSNRLWIGYAGAGWSVLELGTRKFTHFKAQTVFFNPYGYDAANTPDPFLEDRRSGMWITSGYGLHYQDDKGRITTYHDSVRKNGPQFDNLFISICQTDDTTLWLGTWGAGLKKFNTKTKQFTQYIYAPIIPTSAIHNIVLQIVAKSAHELWIGTADQGLMIFNMATGRFTALPHNDLDPNTPMPGECYALMKDRSGILWSGFYTGISRLTPRSQTLSRIPLLPEVEEFRTHVRASSIYKDTAAGKLYVGCIAGRGLMICDERAGLEEIARLPGFFKTSQYKGVSIYCIQPAGRSGLLVSSSEGLFLFNRHSKQFTQLSIKDQEGRQVFATSIFPSSKGYWCNSGPTNGFYYIDRDLSTALHYYNGPGSAQKLGFRRAEVVLVESDTLIWVATFDSGLVMMNPLTKKVRQLNGRPNKSLFGKDMLQQGAGNYWFATDQYGVFNIVKKGNDSFLCKQYSETNGLPSDHTVALVMDKNKNLVVLTEKGPALLQSERRSFINFSENHLVKNIFAGFSSIYSAPDGSLYVGAGPELIRWHPDSLAASVSPPHIMLTSLKIYEKEYNDTIDLASLTFLDLPFEKNSISVSFIAVDFAASTAMKYKYKMDGLNDNWVDAGSNRSAVYSRLPDGNYLLHIRAVNGMGMESENEISLSIHVSAPFWKTGWFIMSCMASLVVVVIFIFRIRVARIRRQEALKSMFAKKMAEMEMKALRAQMNPHFLFNCLNSINRFIVVNETVKASGYLTKFSKLIRLILDTSREETTPLSDEISLLKLYLEMESMRFDNKFRYLVEVDERLPTETIIIPSMIIQPYVENSIWHGLLNKPEGGELLLKFTPAAGNEGLEIVIEDDGIGRKKAGEVKSKNALKEKSFGMQITNDRIKTMNQLYNSGATVQVEDLISLHDEPAGTRVTLHIPLNIKVIKPDTPIKNQR
jgi:ligand-binding sensor domain-containing protein/two-component sensor histidine kinase